MGYPVFSQPRLDVWSSWALRNQPRLHPGGVVEDEGRDPGRDDLHLLDEPLGQELDVIVGGVTADDVRRGIVADAIVAGHLLALELKVEDGGLVGPFGGVGEGGLAQAPKPEMTTTPDWNLGWSLLGVFTVSLLSEWYGTREL